MMITSWNRVLDALQAVAAEGGHSVIEQDIAQLRGLVKTVTSDDPLTCSNRYGRRNSRTSACRAAC